MDRKGVVERSEAVGRWWEKRGWENYHDHESPMSANAHRIGRIVSVIRENVSKFPPSRGYVPRFFPCIPLGDNSILDNAVDGRYR